MADKFNPFEGTREEFSGPARNFLAITPVDSDLPQVIRGVYVGTGGDIVAISANDQEATFIGVVAGSVLPISCKQIKAATTASNLVGLY